MTSCGTEVSSRIDVIVVPTRFHPHVTGSFNRKVRSPLPQSCLFTVSTVQSSWKKSPTFHYDDFYNIFLTLMTSSVHFDLYDVSLTPIFCIFHPFSPHLILQRFSPFFTSSLIFLLFFKMTFTFRTQTTQRIHYRVEFHLKFLTFLVINFDVDVFTEQGVKA